MARPSDPNVKIDLLRAAEAVFLEHGLEKAKIEDITDRAGTSKGAFYLHFKHKESVFRQIVDSMLARLVSCIEQDSTLTDEKKMLSSTPDEWLKFWLDKDVEMFEFVWQNRRVVRLLLEGGRSATFSYMVDAFAERCRQTTKRVLEWGKAAGMYREELDVEIGSLVLAGAYDRVARNLVKSETKPDLRAVCWAVQRILVTGMAAAPLRAASERMRP